MLSLIMRFHRNKKINNLYVLIQHVRQRWQHVFSRSALQLFMLVDGFVQHQE